MKCNKKTTKNWLLIKKYKEKKLIRNYLKLHLQWIIRKQNIENLIKIVKKGGHSCCMGLKNKIGDWQNGLQGIL